MNDNTVWRLARLAECADPDTDASPGALFLRRVEDAVRESRQYAEDYDDHNDLVHEIADGAVPVYTFDRWRTFVDLGAWEQDVADLAGGDDDMTQLAGLALYQAARALADALLSEEQEQ
jgi:hypothetical protein